MDESSQFGAVVTRHVFVYGTLKRGYGNHFLLQEGGAEFVGAAATEWQFKMIAVGFPVITLSSAGHPVRGEIYAVNEATVARLDRLEGEGRMYHRHVVPVVLDDGRAIQCEIYIGDDNYWRGDYGAPVEAIDGHLQWPQNRRD